MKTERAVEKGPSDGIPRYKRVLLKLSGESFGPTAQGAGGSTERSGVTAGSEGFGIDFDTIALVAKQIAQVRELGVQIAVVVGGGNILRGSEAEKHGMDRATADYMGMLATVINALALRDALEKEGVETRVQTAIWMQEIAEPVIRGRAIRHLEKGRAVIFAAGTGNPYFTTDTPAVLRALEVGAEAILMGKRVDGVFDSDPMTNADAKFLPALTYMQVLERDLRVMDATAIALCKDYGIPIHVFNMLGSGNIERVVRGEEIGTVVK